MDKRAREQFYGLFDGIEHVPAREQTLAGAREMLNPNQEVARKQRLASLLAEKRSLADLTAEERQELKALSGQNDD
jgi:DNA primase